MGEKEKERREREDLAVWFWRLSSKKKKGKKIVTGRIYQSRRGSGRLGSAVCRGFQSLGGDLFRGVGRSDPRV